MLTGARCGLLQLLRQALTPTLLARSMLSGLVAAAFGLSCVDSGNAQEVAEGDRLQLEELRVKIEKNISLVGELSLQQKGADKELATIKQQLVGAQKKEKDLISLASDLQRRIGFKEREIADNDLRIQAFTKRGKKRLRALYVQRRDVFSPLLTLFAVPDLVQASRGLFYSSQVRLHDRQLIMSLQELKEAKRRDIGVLGELLRERERALLALGDERKQLAGHLGKQKDIIRGIGIRRKASEKQLSDLRQQASQLEQVLGKLTGSELLAVGVKPAVPREDLKAPAGQGLQSQKGKLIAPVTGPIVRHFGRQRHGQVREMIFHKGVEFAAPAGSMVSAVADGQVLYVGKLPGLDVVVIVDHGDRYYTLYGRLGSVIVDTGSTVVTGQRIGQCAAHPQDEFSGIYFEVRKSGVAVNPADFLAPMVAQK